MANLGHTNVAYLKDEEAGEHCHSSKDIDLDSSHCRKLSIPFVPSPEEVIVHDEGGKIQARQTWGNSLEFLMSCIAMSIGLGNVWRFPFTAFENGGGAFLVPYLIVLFLVGKPIYYMETILGQFSSKSSVKIWNMMPCFRGIGWTQAYAMGCLSTYYCSIMAVTMYYLINSFQTVLPWAKCMLEWGEGCVDSDKSFRDVNSTLSNVTRVSSAALYFTKVVLKQKDNIDDGIGLPDWRLVLCLFITWLSISVILIRGVKSSGKASYFLAIFPYVVMITLLIKAATLEGAVNGIVYFIRPNWDKILEVKVWYAAVTQCFFSLSVCFGSVIMYSSYNNFHHNINRDVTVLTLLDTCTSLIAGFTVFGILGNLAYESGINDISKVIKEGSDLAFISYPDAISKFPVYPQIFSVLFFLMLYILGIGSGVGIIGGVIAIINDQFPHWKEWPIVIVLTVIGFIIGIVYCTPGGQWILNLVDHYAASDIVLFIAMMELVVIFWIFGLENFLDKIEFMLKTRPGLYWRICWGIVTPLIIITIVIYNAVSFKTLTKSGASYPAAAHAAGWVLFAIGAAQIPFWFLYTWVCKYREDSSTVSSTLFEPAKDWGPMRHLSAWRQFRETKKKERSGRNASTFKQFVYVIFCQEHRLSQ